MHVLVVRLLQVGLYVCFQRADEVTNVSIICRDVGRLSRSEDAVVLLFGDVFMYLERPLFLYGRLHEEGLCVLLLFTDLVFKLGDGLLERVELKPFVLIGQVNVLFSVLAHLGQWN